MGFPSPAISEASERLVRDHQAKYAQNSRILQQVRRSPASWFQERKPSSFFSRPVVPVIASPGSVSDVDQHVAFRREMKQTLKSIWTPFIRVKLLWKISCQHLKIPHVSRRPFCATSYVQYHRLWICYVFICIVTHNNANNKKDHVAQVTVEWLHYSQLIFSPLEAAKSTAHCLSSASLETCFGCVCWHHSAVFFTPLPETDSGADPHHQGAVQVERQHSRLLRLRQREQSQRWLPSHLLLCHPVDTHWLT